MPVDWSRYPKDWPEVRERIRARSGDICEWCGAPNHTWILRLPGTRQWHPAPEGHLVDDLVTLGWRLVRIILTTAHLGTPHADGTPGDKHNKMDTRDENLAHLCQRCHLLYDLEDHVQNAAATRRRKKKELGFMELEL